MQHDVPTIHPPGAHVVRRHSGGGRGEMKRTDTGRVLLVISLTLVDIVVDRL